jgi:uncharacterized protein
VLNRSIQLSKYIDKNQSVMLFGARGTGKSVLINRQLPPTQTRFITLLDGADFKRFSAEPSLLIHETRAQMRQWQDRKPYIIAIDEIQKLPSLLDEVHLLIEEFKERLIFVLTGSSARKLKRAGANLLAGRALTKYLHPLSSLELDLDLAQTLSIGSLPGIYLAPEFARERLQSYITTYLKEEILEEALVRKIERFSRFLDLAAQLNGEPINHSKLAKALKTSANTIQEYFSILVDTLISYRVDGWDQSVKRQLLQSPKFYWFDCGVLNAITGELDTEVKPVTFRYGRLFETFLVQEIVRFNEYRGRNYRLYYWRDKNGREVDLILAKSPTRPIAAIEIKSTSDPGAHDFTGLQVFAEDYPEVPRFCLCQSPRAYDHPSGVEVLPWRAGLDRIMGI